MHKISDELEFRPDRTTDYGVSCLWGLKNFHRLIMGKWCLHASSFIFDRIIIKVAGIQDRHKSLDKFYFAWPIYMFFWNEIWPWHIGLMWAIIALWDTCYLLSLQILSFSIQSIWTFMFNSITLGKFYKTSEHPFLMRRPDSRIQKFMMLNHFKQNILIISIPIQKQLKVPWRYLGKQIDGHQTSAISFNSICTGKLVLLFSDVETLFYSRC